MLPLVPLSTWHTCVSIKNCSCCIPSCLSLLATYVGIYSSQNSLVGTQVASLSSVYIFSPHQHQSPVVSCQSVMHQYLQLAKPLVLQLQIEIMLFRDYTLNRYQQDIGYKICASMFMSLAVTTFKAYICSSYYPNTKK